MSFWCCCCPASLLVWHRHTHIKCTQPIVQSRLTISPISHWVSDKSMLRISSSPTTAHILSLVLCSCGPSYSVWLTCCFHASRVLNILNTFTSDTRKLVYFFNWFTIFALAIIIHLTWRRKTFLFWIIYPIISALLRSTDPNMHKNTPTCILHRSVQIFIAKMLEYNFMGCTLIKRFCTTCLSF